VDDLLFFDFIFTIRINIYRKQITPIMEKVNIKQKLSMFSDYWNPRIAGELNGQHVKLVKFKGEFVWHKHDHEDEMFFVISGSFNMELRDKTIELSENEFLIVPRGVEHRPVAAEEVSIMLFEPATTLNTGNVGGEFTKYDLEKI
jgi:mannose-6-phosphate isomerase-like protein (cupin superfamily)